MRIYDTDILSDIFEGRGGERYEAVRKSQEPFFTTIVTVEEQLRGFLSVVKRASQSPSLFTLAAAYDSLSEYARKLARCEILPYTITAHAIFKNLKHLQHKVGTRDLRIACICLAHDVTLVTRNKQDFEKVPNLKLDVWN